MTRLAVLLFLSLAAPAYAGTIRLTWLHSGLPAASLDVRLDGGAVVRSDGNGAVDAGRAGAIVVTDPETGLHLVEGTVTAGAVIRVPEPIRLRGRATGVEGALIVRAGDGPRAAPAQAPHGVSLPATPLRWTGATVDGRQFTSGWVVADPPPQVVLSDERGNTASLEIAIGADVRPRTTVDIGAIALEPSALLEVAPEGGRVASAELHLRDVTIDDADAAARELAGLEQRRLFELLVLGRPYYLAPDEESQLAIPRWLSRATLVLRDSYDDHGVERTVSFTPGKAVRLEWPKTPPQAVIGGVIASGGAPLANATVVVPDGARRRETKTDIGGRFRFDGVHARARVPVYVDAGTGNGRRTAVYHVAPRTDLSLDLPPAAPDTVDLPLVTAATSPLANCGVGDDQYPIVVEESIPAGATYQYALDWNAVTMTVVADRPGTYAFNVYATPFFFLQASVQVTSPAPATAPMTYIQPQNVALLVLNKNGFALPAGLELSFSPPDEIAEWLDATELDLTSSSTVALPCVNINPLALYINDGGSNGCDGDLTLTSTSCTIFLPSSPTQPCACH